MNKEELKQKVDRIVTSGEIQGIGKVNRVITGWALSNHKNGINCRTAQMPIFWNRKVAQKYADEWGEKLKQVKILIL